MTGAWANVDGWIGPAHEARVSPVDAGFLYGEAVYENLRTYDHVPFLFARHLSRLRHSARFLGIPLAVSDAGITARLRATQEATGITREHSLRVILTAGPQGGEPSLIILVRPLPPLPVDPEQDGVGVSAVGLGPGRSGRTSGRREDHQPVGGATGGPRGGSVGGPRGGDSWKRRRSDRRGDLQPLPGAGRRDPHAPARGRPCCPGSPGRSCWKSCRNWTSRSRRRRSGRSGSPAPAKHSSRVHLGRCFR